MIKYLFSVIGLYFLLLPIEAQNKKAWRAYTAYEAGEYYEAIDLLKNAYDVVNDKDEKVEMLYLIAESYRNTNDPRKAELWYKKAIGKGYPDPTAVFWYAEMLKMNEKYEEAIDEYKRYKSLVPDDPKGENGVLSCELALEWLENPSAYEIENMKFFNSRESDYSPAFARADYMEVCFTSSRDESEGTEMHGATGESFTDIYFSRQDRKGKWSTPVPLEEPINTEFEDGTPSISPDFNTMYFTRCKMSKNKNFGCQILSATKSGENWGKAQEIEIAGDSITIAHPAISPDNLTLYFVSDMDGGAGGKDIWKITRESANGNWADPENLGEPINTDQDEVFPYVHPDGTLYFSSNGHIGMGGLDIFKATENEDGKWEVENMKTPINSASDDFGIVFQADEERGFFSSSRGLRNNDDIYAFVLPPLKFNIEGVVKDEKTEEPLDNVLVKSIGSDGITLESTTGKKGEFKFMLRPNTDYVFLASREGYLRGKERETTKGLGKSKDFNTTIFLASIDKPIQLPNIFYDFNKADLRPESMVTLDRLVETLNDNPNVTIEIMSHTDYRGSDSFNDELSQKRAQSVVNYLIEKGIAPDRLSAKGYGETRPKTIDSKIAEEWPFFEEGVTLTEAYIKSLESLEQQEVANQINRITEFRVLSTDYKQK